MEKILLNDYIKKEKELVEKYKELLSREDYFECSHNEFFKIMEETLEGEIKHYDLDHNYSGDYLIIVGAHDKFYICRYGYGSCSGCDSIYGAETGEELCANVRYIVSELKECPLLLVEAKKDMEEG